MTHPTPPKLDHWKPWLLADYKNRDKLCIEALMTDLIWLNGEIIPMADARIGVEDRGFQFADGVYEVVRLYNAKPFTLNQHLARLHQSAQAIGIPLPLPIEQLSAEIHKLIAQSQANEAMVYLQLTRGIAPRNHQFPDHPKPTLLFYTRPLPPVPPPGQSNGVKLCAVPDERWKRCWIKSIALLPNILAKNHAIAHGFDEAAFVEEGILSECSSSNLFAIFANTLVTAPAGPRVLPGITRAVLLDLAPQTGLQVDERPLLEQELLRADEVFITSTTREISWVSHYNQNSITPHCGPQTLRLHLALRDKITTDMR